MPDIDNTAEQKMNIQQSVPKKEKKACVIISDPEIIKTLLDDKRKAILRVLRNGIVEKPVGEDDDDQPRRYEMTAIEIVEQLKTEGYPIKKSAVYFHLDKLEAANLIEVARKEQKKRSQITYYRRTAQIFLISYRDAPEVREEVRKVHSKKGDKYIDIVVQAYIPEAKPEVKERVKQLMNDLHSNYEELQLQLPEKMKGEIPDNKALKVFQTGLDVLLAANERHYELSKELSKLLFDQ
ncbi:MAG: hypothetical protein ACFFD4_03780 [Candidatus Odinarchaeota archaeon]